MQGVMSFITKTPKEERRGMEEPSSHAIWQRNLSELGARQRSPGAGSSATSQGHSPARCALGLLQIYRAGTLLALIMVRSWHADTDQGA